MKATEGLNFDALEFESFSFILKIGLFRGSLSRFEVKRVEIGRIPDRLTRQTNAKKNENYFTKIFNICWCVVGICALAMRLRISNKRGIIGADLNICISMCLKRLNPTASLFTTFLAEIEFIQNLTHLIYF